MRFGGLVSAAILLTALSYQTAGAGPSIGDPAPDFCEPDTASAPCCLSGYQNNCILLTFWNTG